MFNLFVPRMMQHFTKINKNDKILDIGCGANSVIRIKKIIPKCEYHGLDMTKNNYSSEELLLMEKFYDIDLEIDDLNNIPDNYFDKIIVSHVIEHISNGLNVIKSLISKLNEGGELFIEWPGDRALKRSHFLNMTPGLFQFCGDKTHKRLYHIVDVGNILLEHDLLILDGGIRRKKINIILLPFIILKKIIKKQSFDGAGIWDLIGFSYYIIAKK